MSPSSRYLIPYTPIPHTGGDPSRPAIMGSIALWFKRVRERSRQRAELDHMSDRDLHDAGLYRSEVEFALSSKAWRL